MSKKNKPKSGSQTKTQPPAVHEDLRGMNISVNEFGEIIKDYNVDTINAFLDKNVKDKKLDGDAS